MNETISPEPEPAKADSGLSALCGIAAYYRVAVDRDHIARELNLIEKTLTSEDIIRAAKFVGMRARLIRGPKPARIRSLPLPAIARSISGEFLIIAGPSQDGGLRIIDPISQTVSECPLDTISEQLGDEILLIQRQINGPGVSPRGFGLSWFIPSFLRYKTAFVQTLMLSLILQILGLISPLFFQVIVDKVLVHAAYSTLTVVIVGLCLISLFETILSFTRSYILTHTANRIDVELGQRLFAHLLRLPISYFETRPAGQTVARVRELETVRTFVTSEALFSVIDFVFTIVMMSILFLYSTKIALAVLVTIPIYGLIVILIGPTLREKVKEKFSRGAYSQQFLVESIIGAQTIKAAAVEPPIRSEWEERLAAYVSTGFSVSLLASGGQSAIQLVNKLSTAIILLIGAKAVIDGDLTIGALVACNMIAGQIAQPVLRLAQLWQDFQQVGISIDRLGDILNAEAEPANPSMAVLPPPAGAIEFRDVSFRYSAKGRDVLSNISFKIKPGEVIGIVGPSGSGKSSLTKLVQRFYVPHEGQILIDGLDITQIDPAWLRRNIGVVLQENFLFAKTIHENIALAQPSMSRARVMALAQLSGAHEFIAKLPMGYDTIIEERGANLSGGQRQRIAIARALAVNPRILILDEATSALDYESERIIQTNMTRIAKGRTVIIVAHRLSTVKSSDRIIGMVDGHIVEMGSHQELLQKQNGLYARLWDMQSSGVQ